MSEKQKKERKKKPKKTARRWSAHEKVFLVLIIVVLILGSLNVAKAKGWLILEQPQIEVIDGTIRLDSLSLEQKIAQMIIVHGGRHNLKAWKSMQLGGIHLFAMENGELFREIINEFQTGMEVPFFVTADLEGCFNPFGNFYDSAVLSEIETEGEAFQKGSDDGKFMSQLGFTINFAPVVDLDDQIWKCRSFSGDEIKISELAESYILGLQKEGVIATAKHYPGKTLVVKDPHKELVIAEISKRDLYPYEYLSGKEHGNSFMVSHLIVSGEANSEGVPSVVSDDVIAPLKEGSKGLIISDDTMMLGLRKFYDSKDEMYIAVFKAGNDLVINFDEDPNEIYHMIQTVKGAVEEGIIDEAQIDNSVRKILQKKGFVVE